MSRVPARLSDPNAPSWTWLVAAAGAVGIAAAAPPIGLDARIFALGGLAALLGAPLFRIRPRTRDVDLALGHGKISAQSPFPFGTRIRGRRLLGASTCYLPDGRALLTLHGRRIRTLELADGARAKEVRDALGIGHYGFGWIRFVTVRSRASVIGAIAQTLGALSALFALYESDAIAAAVIFALVALGCALGAGNGIRGCVELTAAGIGIYSRSRPIPFEQLRYADIREVLLEDEQLVLVLENGKRVEAPLRRRFLGVARGLGDEEALVLRAQIESAVARAHGLGPAEPEIDPTVAELGAVTGGARGWLERIEAMAARLANSGGYRGAPISEDDLWTALENHDADPDVRAAAARVLARAHASRCPRILEVAQAARDPRTERRIRIALLPEDEAEKKLAKLMEEEEEAEEATREAAARGSVVHRAAT